MTEHDPIDKKALSERDICTKFITPAIKEVAGWGITQFYEEFTLGKIHGRGKRVARGVRDRADYILFYNKNQPLAIPPLVEQKCIVKRVERLLGWCDAMEAQLKSARSANARRSRCDGEHG